MYETFHSSLQRLLETFIAVPNTEQCLLETSPNISRSSHKAGLGWTHQGGWDRPHVYVIHMTEKKDSPKL